MPAAPFIRMNPLRISVVLGLLVGGWAQVVPNPIPVVSRPPCDSPETEDAALVALQYLNDQHTHGYKYALNRIEEIKIMSRPGGDDTYFLEIELLETNCHVLDPTPVANCTVRPKVFTAIEGDCDVVLKKVQGVLTVTAFKCKTEESTEDLCLGCPTLLPLNDTSALDFVHASLATFNNITVNASFTLLEVGRMSSQVVSGGLIYAAEYVIVEANCTDDYCVPLTDATAQRGLCHAKGLNSGQTVDCHMFVTLIPPVDANSTLPTGPVLPPVVHIHRGNLTTRHGLRHHQLTSAHYPELLSAESAESQEMVPVVLAGPAPVVPAPQPVPSVNITQGPCPVDSPVGPATDFSSSMEFPPLLLLRKREAPNTDVPASAPPAVGVPTLQLCPGRIRFF